jgi:hypothetical protein
MGDGDEGAADMGAQAIRNTPLTTAANHGPGRYGGGGGGIISQVRAVYSGPPAPIPGACRSVVANAVAEHNAQTTGTRSKASDDKVAASRGLGSLGCTRAAVYAKQKVSGPNKSIAADPNDPR